MTSQNMARGTNVYRAGPKGDAVAAKGEPIAIVNEMLSDREATRPEDADLPPLRFGFQPRTHVSDDH